MGSVRGTAMRTPRILVVEDNRIVARDIQRQLRQVGYEVAGTAASGEDAISLARQTVPDLVLMDICLEGAMDGVDAARAIGATCPVVFLTAYADDETVSRATQSEPFGYLLKPFDELQLRTSIEMALRRHGAEDRLRKVAEQHAATLASIADALIATDEFGGVTFMNPSAEALTGWSRARATGHALENVLGVGLPADDQPVRIARDGRSRWLDHCTVPIRDEDGRAQGAVLVLRERHAGASPSTGMVDGGRARASQDLLVTMADGISQPLMAIVTNAASCLRWLKAGNVDLEEAFRAVERIVDDGHRAGNLVSNIRSFAQAPPPSLAAFDLGQTILDAIGTLEHEARQGALSWQTALDGRSRWALGDRAQIALVLHQLVTNGISALGPSTGPITVALRTSIDEHGEVMVSVAISEEGNQALEDTPGAAPGDTSSPWGVSMAICRSIIEAHGGRLWTLPGAVEGTAIRFSLRAAGSASDREMHA